MRARFPSEISEKLELRPGRSGGLHFLVRDWVWWVEPSDGAGTEVGDIESPLLETYSVAYIKWRPEIWFTVGCYLGFLSVYGKMLDLFTLVKGSL